MYLILSLVISLLTAYALSSFYSFFIVFIISFFAVLCLSCYIDTIATGDNKFFRAGCKTFMAFCTSETWGWWLLYWLPPSLFVGIAIIGGIITAPIWYFISHTKSSISSKVFLWTIVALMAILYVLGIILLINPLIIYKIIHYGWIIGLFIGIAVLGLIITIVLRHNLSINKGVTALMSIGSIGLIPVIILGVVLSLNATYYISKAEDMKVLANAPTNYNTAFVLENDIDFTDKDVSWFGGQKKFEGIFDGQGYTLSNIHIKTKCKSMNSGEDSHQGLGFVRENWGIIRNLNFKDCTFTISPKDSNEYSDLSFGIITAYNTEKISNCNIIDCYAKYTIGSNAEANVSLSIGKNSRYSETENINVINNNPIDESFYTEDDINWKKIS